MSIAIKSIITFVLVVSINVFYVYYVNAVRDNKPLIASTWSSLINLASSIAAIIYIQENWIIIPSCMGSFVGTYIGTKLIKH